MMTAKQTTLETRMKAGDASMERPDVLVVGAGPVGLSLAIALATRGLSVTVADARTEQAAAGDPRTLALSYGTRLTLERLGVWSSLAPTPIDAIHVSQQGGFGRSLIRATEEQVPALGYVAGAGELAAALQARARALGVHLRYHTEAIPEPTDTPPGTTEPGRTRVVLRAAGEPGRPGGRNGPPIPAHLPSTADATPAPDRDAVPAHCAPRLVAHAEGGLRADQPGVAEHDYRQHALIGFVDVQGGHRGTAYERFTAEGPVALLPCGTRHALVHVATPATADALMALDDAHYLARLQSHLGGRVTLTGLSERQRYPLMLRYRREPVGPRSVWLGNAAQTLHPVAGQGFNLALRDVWALAEALRDGDDPGDAALLARFARDRGLDRLATIRFTDTLVRVFSNDFAPLRRMRGIGLFALDLCPPLRSFVARRMMFGARAWP
ncbi:MAG: FAD-dependent oxidoreductase [Rhodocyclaceae bacterium]